MGFRHFSLFLAEVSGQGASNELFSVKFGSLGASERHLHLKKNHVTVFLPKAKKVYRYNETAYKNAPSIRTHANNETVLKSG